MDKLYVVCGHGAGDPGACGNGYQEAERVRVLGARIKALGGDNVILGDTSRNFYADNGISKLNISKDCQIIELHMDSAAASARGAHVIIYGGFSADAYDKALAKFLSGMFPGRANTIVGRNDLANPARAAAKGYGYRLVECGFISNATDVSIFNANIDNIAKGILECFGIKASGNTAPKPTPEPTPTPSTGKIEVGASVKLKSSATHYVTGQAIPSWVKNQAHKVSQVSNDRVLLGANGGICSWVWLRDIEGAASASGTSITKGSTIKIKNGATDLNTGGRYDSWVYSSSFKVIQVSGNRVVFGNSNGAVIGATDKSNCY